MRKQLWPSILFLIAFAISLAHSSIPHSHPLNNKPTDESKLAAHHDHDHGHSSKEHSHDQDSHLPVFSHFSNVDYIGNVKLNFPAKAKVLKTDNSFAPTIITYGSLTKTIDKTPPIPRARELPILYLPSANSLRAPPIHINQGLVNPESFWV